MLGKESPLLKPKLLKKIFEFRPSITIAAVDSKYSI